MREKRTFQNIFLFFALLLMVLPVLLTFNDVLTKLMKKFVLYIWLQERIVPLQTQFVGLLVRLFGIFYLPFKDGMLVNGLPMKMTWNCLGWQSMLILVISIIFGLRGNFTLLSRLECILLGFFGTLLVNVLRMAIVAAGIFYINQIFALVVHDYLVALMTIGWLAVFWWFSYAFVLEEKSPVKTP